MKFTTAVHTDIGIKKKTNQDSALIVEARSDLGNILLTVICDGMGGLAKGEVASSTVTAAFSAWFENDLPRLLSVQGNVQQRIFEQWGKLILDCNSRISAYGKKSGVSMGTTLNAVLFLEDKYYIVNVGDSRAYQISDQLYQLTKDQTFVQREMDAGRMTAEEARVSPQRNVLLQCIGASEFIEPEYFSGTIALGQVYMQCSDGFRHIITPEEIYQYLNPAALVNEQAMIDNAVYLTELNKYRRENDNITVLLVKTE